MPRLRLTLGSHEHLGHERPPGEPEDGQRRRHRSAAFASAVPSLPTAASAGEDHTAPSGVHPATRAIEASTAVRVLRPVERGEARRPAVPASTITTMAMKPVASRARRLDRTNAAIEVVTLAPSTQVIDDDESARRRRARSGSAPRDQVATWAMAITTITREGTPTSAATARPPRACSPGCRTARTCAGRACRRLRTRAAPRGSRAPAPSRAGSTIVPANCGVGEAQCRRARPRRRRCAEPVEQRDEDADDLPRAAPERVARAAAASVGETVQPLHALRASAPAGEFDESFLEGLRTRAPVAWFPRRAPCRRR